MIKAVNTMAESKKKQPQSKKPKRAVTKRDTPVDWEAVERDWRAGIKSKAQMSKDHGVSRPAIEKHFASLKIERDLSEKIRQKANALVAAAAVADRLQATEIEIVDANAQNNAAAQNKQIEDIEAHNEYLDKMFSQLLALQNGGDLLDKLEELVNTPNAEGDSTIPEKLLAMFRYVTSIPGQVDTGKKFFEMYRMRFDMTRKVLRIDEGGSAGSGIDDLLLKLGKN